MSPQLLIKIEAFTQIPDLSLMQAFIGTKLFTAGKKEFHSILQVETICIGRETHTPIKQSHWQESFCLNCNSPDLRFKYHELQFPTVAQQQHTLVRQKNK